MNRLKKHLVQILLGLAIGLVFLGHAGRFYQIPLVNTLDAFIYDARLRLTMPGGVDDRIVILDIDEKSLAEGGRWPWGRDKMAALLDQLFDKYGVAVLGFDVVFAEPDGSSGLRSLEALAKKELKDDGAYQNALRGLRTTLDYDRRFAESMSKRPVVLGYYFTNFSEARVSGKLPDPVLSSGTFKGRNLALTSWNGYGANLPEYQANAASAGHFVPLVDFDGISRRVPMVVEYQGGYYESLSLAMVRLLLGMPSITPGYADDGASSRDYAGLEWLELTTPRGSVRIPVDESAATLIPYRGGQGSFRYLSISDALHGRLPVEALKGKIVVVGTTTPGLMDLRATPVGATYPGVEIHANLIAGMLDGSIKLKPAYVLGAEVLMVMLCTLILALLLPLLSPMRATLLAGVMLLAAGGLNLMLWTSGGLLLPLASTLLLIVALYALSMSWGYFVESRSKRQFTELFGQYVPPELVDEMARDPERYSMEGRSEELTVLFADVR
ncbi:MAG: adenylate cyclase, partial [Pseudomonadota bacterium]|nr:adenylate cyclase [Pseudomonadota bacterium]